MERTCFVVVVVVFVLFYFGFLSFFLSFPDKNIAMEMFNLFSDRQGFQVGSLSHMINLKASGYQELPPYPEVAPDPSVRNVEVSLRYY